MILWILRLRCTLRLGSRQNLLDPTVEFLDGALPSQAWYWYCWRGFEPWKSPGPGIQLEIRQASQVSKSSAMLEVLPALAETARKEKNISALEQDKAKKNSTIFSIFERTNLFSDCADQISKTYRGWEWERERESERGEKENREGRKGEEARDRKRMCLKLRDKWEKKWV